MVSLVRDSAFVRLKMLPRTRTPAKAFKVCTINIKCFHLLITNCHSVQVVDGLIAPRKIVINVLSGERTYDIAESENWEQEVEGEDVLQLYLDSGHGVRCLMIRLTEDRLENAKAIAPALSAAAASSWLKDLEKEVATGKPVES